METSKMFYVDLMNIYLEVGNINFEVILANIHRKLTRKTFKFVFWYESSYLEYKPGLLYIG